MADDDLSELGRAAMWYVTHGYAVFPLKPRSKEPMTRHGVNDWTDDPESVRAVWSKYPDANIGIACGRPSGGLVCIDLDEHEDVSGYETLRRWENEYGALPETCSVVTGGGGTHLLYRFGGEVRPGTNRAVAVDIRGDGSYFAAPPSVHPNGRRYEWETSPDEVSVAWADANVTEFVESVRPRKESERFTAPSEVAEGGRNDTIFKLACSMQARDEPDAEIMDYCLFFNQRRCRPPLPEGEVRRTVESALGYRKGLSDEARALARDEADRPSPDVMALLDKSKEGAPKPTVHNYAVILANDEATAGRLWFNRMAYCKYITTPCPWDEASTSRPVGDYDYGHMQSYIEHRYGVTMNKNKLMDAVGNVCTTNARNPLTEWLDSLVWDGEERAWSVLPTFLGAEATDYVSECTRVWMLAAVARAYEPGTKFDAMLVLAGPQGIGKSSMARLFAMRDDWYLDNLNTVEVKEAAEKIRGMWVCEMAELLATKRMKDIEAVKAFVSSQADTIRPAYARETERRPRTCVFIGTTNSGSFLTDKTGNRRYMTITCGVNEPVMSPINPGERERAFMGQAWAEIVHAWKTERPPLILPERVAGEFAATQERYTEDDPREGMIRAYLDVVARDPSRPNKRVCVAELCAKALGMEPRDWQGRKATVNEIHEIVGNIEGWQRCKGKQRCGEYGTQTCYEPSDAQN